MCQVYCIIISLCYFEVDLLFRCYVSVFYDPVIIWTNYSQLITFFRHLVVSSTNSFSPLDWTICTAHIVH